MMMLVHEGGHVLGAMASGGKVVRVVWHPRVISRTDVFPNPHPLVEVSAGPVVGSLVPLVAAVVASGWRLRRAYLLWAFAGFCLIANGLYVGLGALDPVGDTRELISLHTPVWVLAACGSLASVAGILMWDRISPRFGFGNSPAEIEERDVMVCLVAAGVTTLLGSIFGNAG